MEQAQCTEARKKPQGKGAPESLLDAHPLYGQRAPQQPPSRQHQMCVYLRQDMGNKVRRGT